MRKKEFKPINFICRNCGYDFGRVEKHLKLLCPICKSNLEYDGLCDSCFAPNVPLWIPTVAVTLLAFGLLNALFLSPLASYGLIFVLLSLPFFLWHKNNKQKAEHAEKLHIEYTKHTEQKLLKQSRAQQKDSTIQYSNIHAKENIKHSKTKDIDIESFRIIISCPSCLQKLRVTSDKTIMVHCKKCGHVFRYP